LEKIHELSAIDPWWLYKCKKIVDMTQQLRTMTQQEMTPELMTELKLRGFGDRQIALNLNDPSANEDSIRELRKAWGITPNVKQIDTLAAEYPAQTNYLYVTYQGEEHDVDFGTTDAIVLGGGTYKIGSSVEFDYSAVSALRTMRELGKNTCMINYNPETVSTDYDETERLYFDELSLERVLDINDLESPSHGICVSVGGQIPNTLALPLYNRDVKIMGTSPLQIDNAEDRSKFSALLDKLGIDQPNWSELTTYEEAQKWCQGQYPVLVRPSYVLSGGGMAVIREEAELREYLKVNSTVSRDFPVVVSKFEEGSREADVDAVADNGRMVAHCIASHIEDAGVHSGDASLVIPPHSLTEAECEQIKDIAMKLGESLNISGPYNAQILFTPDGKVKVIECNVRASRSLPFMSKATNIPFIDVASKIFVNEPYDVPKRVNHDQVGVKCAQFSFTRLLGSDPTLGVEMASTGEVACFGENMHEAFLKAMLSTHFKLPRKNILISAGSQESKDRMLPYVNKLVEMGYTLYATPGTQSFFEKNNVPSRICHFPDSPEHPQASDLLASKSIDLLINLPSKDKSNYQDELKHCYRVRRAAVDFSCPIITEFRIAEAMINALSGVTRVTVEPYDYIWSDRTYVPEEIDTSRFVNED
jgi:carbamoyl-phosphate synthase large subunit